MEHSIGSLTLPKVAESGTFTDSLCTKLASVLQDYANEQLGEAYQQVSHGDGYIVNNTMSVPWANMIDLIVPQLPALFVYRTNTVRTSFTMMKDILTSTVHCDYILPITHSTQEQKWGILNAVVGCIESALHRDIDVDGYSLSTHLGVEQIRINKSEAKVLKLDRFQSAEGFYVSSTQLEVVEMVSPATETEGVDTLTSTTMSIDLGGTDVDGETAYPLEDFIEIEGLE